MYRLVAMIMPLVIKVASLPNARLTGLLSSIMKTLFLNAKPFFMTKKKNGIDDNGLMTVLSLQRCT